MFNNILDKNIRIFQAVRLVILTDKVVKWRKMENEHNSDMATPQKRLSDTHKHIFPLCFFCKRTYFIYEPTYFNANDYSYFRHDYITEEVWSCCCTLTQSLSSAQISLKNCETDWLSTLFNQIDILFTPEWTFAIAASPFIKMINIFRVILRHLALLYNVQFYENKYIHSFEIPK